LKRSLPRSLSFLGVSTALVAGSASGAGTQKGERKKEKVQPIMKANTAVDRASNQKLHVLAAPFVSWKTLYSKPNFSTVFSWPLTLDIVSF
jgi:hypothetical protein